MYYTKSVISVLCKTSHQSHFMDIDIGNSNQEATGTTIPTTSFHSWLIRQTHGTARNCDAGGFLNSTDVVPADDVPVADWSSELILQPLLSPLIRTYLQITYCILSNNTDNTHYAFPLLPFTHSLYNKSCKNLLSVNA